MHAAVENVIQRDIHPGKFYRRRTQYKRQQCPLHWLIAFALVATLIFSSGSAGIAIADEGLSTQPAPATQSTPATQAAPATQPVPEAAPAKPEEPNPAIIPIMEDTAEVRKNLDKVHDGIEQGILGQVVRFDNYFGGPKGGDERKTGYQLQVRNFARVEKGGNLSIGASLRASAIFSKINDRLRLYISGYNEPEPIAPRLPEDPGNPGFDRPAQSAKIVNTELRYGFFQTPSTDIFLGAGFRLAIPTETFVRTRGQHTHHFNDVTLIRLGETIFVNNIVTLGETTEISLERVLNPKNLLQWASAGTVAHGISGLEWGTELSLLHLLSPKSSITFTGGVYGNTNLEDVISNYRLLARYRQNFLRSWLFYELVPEFSWPRISEDLYHANYAMTFVLEVKFKGNSSEMVNRPAKP